MYMMYRLASYVSSVNIYHVHDIVYSIQYPADVDS